MELFPKILSIITVSSNDVDRLRKTIDSLLPLDPRVEHVIVVPQKDYITRTFLDELRGETNYLFNLVDDQGRGIYEAMNKGAHASRAKYFTFWNSGDYLDSRTQLELLLSELEQSDAFWVITSGVFDQYQTYIPQSKTLEDFLLQKEGGYISHQCVLFSKTAFQNQPFFNFKYKVAADTDQIFRVSAISKPYFLPFAAVHIEEGKYSATHQRLARLEVLLVILRILKGGQRVVSTVNFLRKNFTYLVRKGVRLLG